MNRAQRRQALREGTLSDMPISKPPDPKRPKVCLAVIHSDFQDALWVKSIRALERYDHFGSRLLAGDIDVASGPLLSAARNQTVQNFLNTGYEWLWCLDDDMVFAPDVLERMMALADVDERPIIGSLYYGGGHSAVIRPHIFLVFRDEDGHPYTEVRDEFPTDVPFECDAVGAGSLIIHRRVLEAVGEKWKPHTTYPWFAETEGHGRSFGEDVTFCIRARACGFPIWVDPTIYWGHSKRYIIDGQVYARQKAALAQPDLVTVGDT